MSFIKRHADVVASLALFGSVLVYAVYFINFNIPPLEDAAMLMRYADHLAHGYGIVWNIGDHPVDGATDFLFMVVSAALIKIGVPVGRAVRSIGFVSYLITVLVVYWANRKLWNANIWLSLLSGFYLAVGTGLPYVAAFFGTPFFALFALLTWTLSLLLMQKEGPSDKLSVLFAFSGLATGLIRPEGVILACLMLVAIIVMKGWQASIRTIAMFAGVFLVFGGAYFVWHWNYFGYPFPNPFYKKSGGVLHWDSFQASFINVLSLCGPFLLAYLLGLRSTRTTRQTIAFLIPVVGFASAFILISDEMNFGERFQYALLPIVLISWYPLVAGLVQEVRLTLNQIGRRSRIVLVLGLLVVSGAVLYSSYMQGASILYSSDGRYDVAKLLEPYADRGYNMATSEAGLLPYFSRWRAIDTWGLNDEWIAHHGGITADYLDQYRPELIIFHAHFSPLDPPTTPDHYPDPAWFKMTMTLKDYAESHHYILAAIFGVSPYDTHYYYVRPDFADSGDIVRLISKLKKYSWTAEGGTRAVNYVDYSNP